MIFDIVYATCIFAMVGYIVHGIAMYYPIMGAIMYAVLAVLFFLAVFPFPDIKRKRRCGRGRMSRVRSVQIYKKGAGVKYD